MTPVRVLSRAGALAVLLGAALTGLGCGGGDVTAPTTGSIVITTSTSGPEPDADGYGVTIDEGAETAIPASGTLQRDNVEPGNHSIRLTGMAANCTVAGENPRTVSIPGGEMVTVTFQLTCSATTGRLGLATQPSAEAQSGVQLVRQPVVQLEDPTGQTVAQGNVRIEASLASGGGTLSGTTTRTTDGNGRAAYSDLIITGPAGQYTLKFEAPGGGYTGITSQPVLLAASPYLVTKLDFRPNKLNNLGHIVGTTNETIRAVIWRDGVLTDLGLPEGWTSKATALNNHDIVVGETSSPSFERHGFLWDGTAHDLGNFFPLAINDAGEMTGEGNEFRSGATTTSVDCELLGLDNHGLNNRGQVVGTWRNPAVPHGQSACLWDYGGGRGLDFQDNDHQTILALDINDQGVAVGRYFEPAARLIGGFAGPEGALRALPGLGTGESSANAINEAGVVVGESAVLPSGAEEYPPTYPVVWKDGTITKLSESYGRAFDINDKGQILGFVLSGLAPQSDQTFVLWTPE